MPVLSENRCPDCVKTFVDELRGIAYNIEKTPYYGEMASESESTRAHDMEVLQKVANLFENMFCINEPQSQEDIR